MQIPLIFVQPLDFLTFLEMQRDAMAMSSLDIIIFFILTINSLSQISHCAINHMERVSITMTHVQPTCRLTVQNISTARRNQTDAAVTSKHRVTY